MKFSARRLHSATEVQTNFHWDVSFSGRPFQSFGEDLRMRMTGSSLPKSEVKNLDVVLHGFKFPQPGIVNRNGTIELEAVEMVDQKTMAGLKSWENDIYSVAADGDITGIQRVEHRDLFGTVTMKLYNKTEKKVTKTYTLRHVLLSELDEGQSLQDGVEETDYAKPKITLAYAWYNWGLGELTNN